MNESLNFEYEAVKHYARKGIFARTGLISQLILDLKGIAEKESRNVVVEEYGINDNEGISILQIAIVSHIMMLIEDLAVICKSIKEGKIDYYKYLDGSGDEDLGKIIGSFYIDINNASDDEISKILSYADLNTFEYVSSTEKESVSKIMNQIMEQSRMFFNKVTLFRINHIKIFRRYKHAGFPILLSQKIPDEVGKVYAGFEFLSLSLTSRNEISSEMVPLPYSEKAIISYENLTKDILSFLGCILHFKLICLERKLTGVIPHSDNLFGIMISEKEMEVLNEVWKRIEIKNPRNENVNTIYFNTNTEMLHWYTDIDNSMRRIV